MSTYGIHCWDGKNCELWYENEFKRIFTDRFLLTLTIAMLDSLLHITEWRQFSLDILEEERL